MPNDPPPPPALPLPSITVALCGQTHDNAEWLRELKAKIEDLYQQKKPIILCAEHGQDFDPATFARQKSRTAAIGAYFDAVEALGESPTVEGFGKAAQDFLVEEYLKDQVLFEIAKQDIDAYARQEFAKSVSDRERNRGMTAAYQAEAALWRMAADKQIPAVGIDRFKDSEKAGHFNDGSNAQHKLAELEFPRVEHMAGKLTEQAMELGGTGGCIIVVNLGAAHLASLETLLQRNVVAVGLEKQAQIKPMVAASSSEQAVGLIRMSPGEILEANAISDPEAHEETLADLRQQAGLLEEVWSKVRAITSTGIPAEQSLAEWLDPDDQLSLDAEGELVPDLWRNVARKLDTQGTYEDLKRQVEAQSSAEQQTHFWKEQVEGLRNGKAPEDVVKAVKGCLTHFNMGTSTIKALNQEIADLEKKPAVLQFAAEVLAKCDGSELPKSYLLVEPSSRKMQEALRSGLGADSVQRTIHLEKSNRLSRESMFIQPEHKPDSSRKANSVQ